MQSQTHDIYEPGSEKWSNEQIHEVVKEHESVLTKKKDLGEPQLEKGSKEQIQEVVNGYVAVLTENEDLDAPKHIEEVVKEPKSVLIENDVVREPNSTSIENEDLAAPKSEHGSTEHILEVVKELVKVLTKER
ncbi:hypothetical protein L2E82_51581 [Cichorium intybus]|nr:hypothetical protein L2E82_51581 [Cichorium intybus]